MSDDTVIIRKTPASFAYLFWLSGVRRGDSTLLREEGSTIGRGREVDVLLDDDTVSDEQARIRNENGTWFLYDLAATNRTMVGADAVARRELRDGDRLTFGTTEMAFRALK